VSAAGEAAGKASPAGEVAAIRRNNSSRAPEPTSVADGGFAAFAHAYPRLHAAAPHGGRRGAFARVFVHRSCECTGVQTK